MNERRAIRSGSDPDGAGRPDAARHPAAALGRGGAGHRAGAPVRHLPQLGLETHPHPRARPPGPPAAGGAGAHPGPRPGAARRGGGVDRRAARPLGHTPAGSRRPAARRGGRARSQVDAQEEERKATMSTESPIEIRVTQQFTAAPERVFDAWLDAAWLSRWMIGPAVREEEIVHIELDPRVGGTFSFMVRRDGEEIDHVGEYLELDRPRR